MMALASIFRAISTMAWKLSLSADWIKEEYLEWSFMIYLLDFFWSESRFCPANGNSSKNLSVNSSTLISSVCLNCSNSIIFSSLELSGKAHPANSFANSSQDMLSTLGFT
ncbi:hypothetical protein MANES_16G057589v8 [Manihot esculenta]|uniref:Uncharacterized protein n=1 Tax=Manihot esculenta TaxID=3983 RepID=A0ACB7G6G6_MANES|nr:hypothetical protein MANES_16G057589v8 [Manihot esculenta]